MVNIITIIINQLNLQKCLNRANTAIKTAGNGVKKATERLVESLKRWMEEEEGEEELMMSGKKVSEIAQVCWAHVEG